MSLRLEDLPYPFLLRLLKKHIRITELRALRLVNWRFRALVDSILDFHVPLNNSNIIWTKGCVPYISELILGPLSSPSEGSPHLDLLQWEDNWFPDVEVLTCTPLVSDLYFPKIFQIFPNLQELRLQGLSNQELLNILELSPNPNFNQRNDTLLRNKITNNGSVALDPPIWNHLTTLQIILDKLQQTMSQTFISLSKRIYPNLTTLHFEYRERDVLQFESETLYLLYISWMEIIAAHKQTLKNITLKMSNYPGRPAQYLAAQPPQNLEEWDKVKNDTQRMNKLDANLRKLSNLSEFTLRPHIYERITNEYWSWSFKILANQQSLVQLILDFTDCLDYLRDENDLKALKEILTTSSNTLKVFKLIASSIKTLYMGDIFVTFSSITFDFSMLQHCKNLEKVVLSRSWSRKMNEWGPVLKFTNIQSLPGSLKVLKLYTEAGKLSSEDVQWICNNLQSLQIVYLPISLKKAVVSSLLGLSSLIRFTLVREYDSDIKLCKMKQFCRAVEGLDYFCPEVKTFDLEGRWMDLLIIQVDVDPRLFKLQESLFTRFPEVLQSP